MKAVSFYVLFVIIRNNICAELPNRHTGQLQVYGRSSKNSIKQAVNNTVTHNYISILLHVSACAGHHRVKQP